MKDGGGGGGGHKGWERAGDWKLEILVLEPDGLQCYLE